MSFQSYKTYIEEGDTVILYFNRDVINSIQVTRGEKFTCRFGVFKHEDFIGKQYGLKITSHTGKGFVYLLHPTPELWTLVVPHRTQILYMIDIAFISSKLNLKPGTKVIESGTGSGSFSHSIARTIGAKGHLYTFEYHEDRVETARREFEAHKLDKIITVTHRDVCKDGFGMKNEVNAVFLDLPAPWDAVHSAKMAIDRSEVGYISTFSPCIEQVQKSCVALAEQGFLEIQTYECLVRDYEIKPTALISLDQGINILKNRSKKRKVQNHTEEIPENERDQETIEKDEDEDEKDIDRRLFCKPFPEMRGHTSYLTFATLPPEIV